MTRKLAITLAVLMLAVGAWALLVQSDAVTIVIDGQQVSVPMSGTVGVGGLVIALIALFCAAILLLFVFAWIGIVVLGVFIGTVTIAATLVFPFLLPLLVPLAILWLFVALTRRTRTQMPSGTPHGPRPS